jgi:hypothetical protein
VGVDVDAVVVGPELAGAEGAVLRVRGHWGSVRG